MGKLYASHDYINGQNINSKLITDNCSINNYNNKSAISNEVNSIHNFNNIGYSSDSVPIDPKATPATVELYKFLQSNYLKKMITGCWTETQGGGNSKVVSCSGKYPAIWGQDMSSWYGDRKDPLWNQTWQNTLKGIQTAQERGQIIQINWHWMMVASKVNGVYTRDA